jgi:hypothetical protein
MHRLIIAAVASLATFMLAPSLQASPLIPTAGLKAAAQHGDIVQVNGYTRPDRAYDGDRKYRPHRYYRHHRYGWRYHHHHRCWWYDGYRRHYYYCGRHHHHGGGYYHHRPYRPHYDKPSSSY